MEGQKERIAAGAVRVEGNTILYWLVYSVGTLDSGRFEQMLDYLRDFSCTLFTNKLVSVSAKAWSRQSRLAEQKMNKTVHGMETTVEILHLLDREDDTPEAIMDQWLKILAPYLKVDTAQLYRLSPDAAYMDVVCEWCAQGMVSIYEKTNHLEVLDILRTEKPVILSADHSSNEYRQFMQEMGLRAMMVFPVLCREEASGGNVVLSLNLRKRRHVWSVPEIRFVSEAVRVLHSILTRKDQKKALIDSRNTVEELLDNVSCCVYVADKETGETLFSNRRMKNTFARELHDNSFQELLLNDVSQEKDAKVSEIHQFERDRWYDLACQEILWAGDRPAMLYSLYDITDKKLYQRKIEQQAYTDFLTGLYNRMCCERDLARQVDAARKSGTKGALLYLDLDDFKNINDGLGHQYGDVLLKAISNSLQRVRGIESSCYRVGGDEFVIVISPDSYPFYDEILANIREIFAKPWFLKGEDYYCTMSMGVVTFPTLDDSVADLIVKADIAMYESKKNGKNRITCYDDGLDKDSGRRLNMEKSMRDAALDGYEEFEIYYQPIMDVREGRTACVGAEALIRWNNTKLGFLPPLEFIPLAEYLGLINPLGNHVLQEACRHCKEWNDNGHPEYRVSVNLSVVQLLSADIADIVEATLREAGLSPENLTLEVTESLAVNDMQHMKKILGKLKSLGVKIALDDFGEGYSSFNHIREIPFDTIKVNQSFVKNIETDTYLQAFVRMVAQLAKSVGADICIEGIETKTQYEILKEMQVKYIQGYYFDHPLKLEDFEAKYCKMMANRVR